jgi:hypothetical protein
VKKNIYLILLFMIACHYSQSQTVVKLWPDGTPGPVVSPKPEETFEGRRVRYVSEPNLTIYLPAKEQKYRGCGNHMPGRRLQH